MNYHLGVHLPWPDQDNLIFFLKNLESHHKDNSSPSQINSSYNGDFFQFFFQESFLELRHNFLMNLHSLASG